MRMPGTAALADGGLDTAGLLDYQNSPARIGLACVALIMNVPEFASFPQFIIHIPPPLKYPPCSAAQERRTQREHPAGGGESPGSHRLHIRHRFLANQLDSLVVDTSRTARLAYRLAQERRFLGVRFIQMGRQI